MALGINQVTNSEKIKKLSIFNLRTGDGIVMKFYVWKGIVSQSSYFKSRPDPLKVVGV